MYRMPQQPDATMWTHAVERSRHGPLSGVRVLDLSALGPGPFASMMLSDFGAAVIAVRRPGEAQVFDPFESMQRGKTVIEADLKSTAGLERARALACEADVLLESARPGVMERLGLGPAVLTAANPRLVYARLTGWGQAGPYAGKAGHDLNYLAISGALGVSGQTAPTAPPALFGDIGNGSYLAAFGIVTALLDRTRTGRGQVVDAAICDGATYSMAGLFGEMKNGLFPGTLGTHVLSGHAPFYRSYRCADGRWFSVGAIENKFYVAFLEAMGLGDVDNSPRSQWSQKKWPGLRDRLDATFLSRPRDDWTAHFADIDACVAPVLEIAELVDDPHVAARRTVARTADGGLRAAPSPRFSGYPDLVTAAGEDDPSGQEDVQTVRVAG